MGINTDLNIDPYFDDFDESKQYNRILFAPAKAVQARELTQMQTILQNQIERFGSNVFKEGTVISGINVTERTDIAFVKIRDSESFVDPTIYNPTADSKFIVRGETTQLQAEIISAVNGFEVRSPDYKTFFIKYLNTQQSSNSDVKQFGKGEILTILNDDGTAVTDPLNGGSMTVVVAITDDHVGKSFGVSMDEGIVYQRGHFIFAEAQSIIVSKYSNVPDDVSVGFTINENIVTSSQDPTLLDNALGFNNFNAPGAARLQLKPTLTVVPSASEPTEFFTIVRYQRGQASAIRDVTEFNSISRELAKRTYEESGNYVVNGMAVSLDAEDDVTYAVVSPGKAYSFGYEINNITPKYLPIRVSDETDTQINQSTGMDYGAYFEVVWGGYPGSTSNVVLDNFALDGTRYSVRDTNDNVIGYCSVRNIIPGIDGQSFGRIYVYAIEKLAGHELTDIYKIANTPVNPTIKQPNFGANIFDTGIDGVRSSDNTNFTRRMRQSVAGGATIVISGTANLTVLDSNVVVVDGTNNLIPVLTASTASNNLTLTVSETDAAWVYYDAVESNVSFDDLTEVEVYVNTIYDTTTKTANLGIPNVVNIVSVTSNTSIDITNSFRLINNQKETFYDISKIAIKAGETAPGNPALLVRMIVLQRTTTSGGGFLTANSYDGIDNSLVNTYTTKQGVTHNLKSCYDFRPYATPWVPYATTSGSAGDANQQLLTIVAGVTPAVRGIITSDIEFYLSRVDVVAIDSSGTFTLIEGSPSKNPSASVAPNSFIIGEVSIPGNRLNIQGQDPVRVRQKTVKNYTMDDIGKIDEQVDRLTEVVSLSLLEQSTRDLFIPDANGLDRFKNGILAEGFNNFQIADIENSEFSAAIDRSRSVSMPRIKQFQVDLKVDSGTNVNMFSEVVTIADTGEPQVLIEQKFGTNVRNAVSNFYNYSGQALITPQFDSGYNVTQNPSIGIEVDIATPLLELIDNIQQFIPLTTTSSDQSTSRNITNEAGGRRITTTTNTLTSTTSLSSTTSNTTQNVGSFVTDIAFNPYIQSREVKIMVTGLRPNTRHYFYFGETDVNQHVINGSIETTVTGIYNVNNVQPVSRVLGSQVSSDANGVLAAVLIIPEGQFFVGEVNLEISDVNQYTSIASGGTSYANVTYRAYNFSVGQAALTSTTRTAEFSTTDTVTTNQSVTSRLIPTFFGDGGPNGGAGGSTGDPLSQTFFVKSGMAFGASAVYVSSIELYFQTKSSSNGAMIELREVVNGYPSSEVLPFGRTHLTPAQINTSTDGSTATAISFDNPVKMSVEREYCFVIIPDANDPNYLLFTSKAGGTDIITGTSVTQDWGDGALFSSTNNRAWQSYQDEDLKFTIKRFEFTTDESYVDLVPNDPEYLTVTGTVGNFVNDELVYAERSVGYVGVGVSGNTVTVPTPSVELNVGDYIILTQGGSDFISSIIGIQTSPTEVVLTLQSQIVFESESQDAINLQLVVVGHVSYFNNRKPVDIHLKGSSARASVLFEANDVVTGYRSGSTSTVVSVDDIQLSYMQTIVYVDNTARTTTTAVLRDNSGPVKSISLDSDTYFNDKSQAVYSTSNMILGDTPNDFIIRIALDNKDFTTISPVVDNGISIVNAYQYQITDTEDTTSKYISKEVVLQEDMSAVGLKVLLAGYRPPGTMIDVYARFTYNSNSDAQSDWIELPNSSVGLYSNKLSISDYKEFEYSLENEDTEYSSFQIKIALRHATSNEKADQTISATDSPSLFPHVYDFRAIALT